MNVLAIGAHFDDIELGCGGTLARHVASGDQVHAYIVTESGFTNGDNKIVRSNAVARQEGQNALAVLGIEKYTLGEFPTLEVEFTEALNKQIIRLVEKNRIDLVYTHWAGDVHHDHRVVARASLHSCRHVPTILMYRSNWYHSDHDFRGNYYVDISDYWEVKEAAIMAHESELVRTGFKWINFFRNEAENAGQRIGVRKAEVFEVVKVCR